MFYTHILNNNPIAIVYQHVHQREKIRSDSPYLQVELFLIAQILNENKYKLEKCIYMINTTETGIIYLKETN